MTWTATVKFAPLLSVERVSDPEWQDADRTMVTEQTFRFPHKKTSVPLLLDHDPDCEIGLVRSWFRLKWLDGEWLAANAELHAPPLPLLERGARVSYGFKPLSRRAPVIGGPEGQVLSDAILTEITVCALQTPLEPLAEVLSVREREPEPIAHRAKAEEEITHGYGHGQLLRRPNIGQVLGVR